MVVGPDSKPLLKITGEGCEEQVNAIIDNGLQRCIDQIDLRDS